MTDPIELTSTAELVELVIGRRKSVKSDGRIIIAIAGPPGAGKSTSADLLVESLNERSPGSAAVLPMDGYHYDDLILNERGWRERKGAPHTFDVAGFAHMLERLRRNEEAEIAVPVFDRSIEIARAGARVIPQSVTSLVVEGNYLLLDAAPWDDLTQHFDLTVFVDVSEEEIRRRLLRRWADLSADALAEQVDGNDMPNVRLVRSQSRQADVILASRI